MTTTIHQELESPRTNLLGIAGAFFVVYFVWGSTFLAVRIAVQLADPLLLAAVRFLAAGAVLLIWGFLRGETRPTWIECRWAAVTATMMFGIGYGALFWAERIIASGIAALVLAMIPVWVSVLEIVLFGLRPSRALIVGLLLGIAGMVLLVGTPAGLHLGGDRSKQVALVVLVTGSLAWSLGTLLQQRLRLPKSVVMRSAIQMCIGGVVLAIAAAITGGTADARLLLNARVIVPMAYLILVGSVLAFSCYLWLLERVSANKVATYAFVNPVVAVLLGASIGGERLLRREWIAGATILIALAFVLSAKARTAEPPSSR